MITGTTNAKEAADWLAKIGRSLTPAQVDPTVDRAAWKVLRRMIDVTPKKWTGHLRQAWRLVKPAIGVRVVENQSKVMLFLEEGTPASAPGEGRIFPRTRRALFIPLTRRAAMQGWSEDLTRGTDYIVRVSVRGIKPRKIVQRERRTALDILYQEFRAFIERVVRV